MSQFVPHLSVAHKSLDFVSTCSVTRAALGLLGRHTYAYREFLYGATQSPVPKGKVFLHRVVSSAGVLAACSLTCPSTQVKQTSTPTKFIQFKFLFQWQSTKISNFFHLAPEPFSPPASPSLLETPLLCLTPTLLSRAWWRGVCACVACMAFIFSPGQGAV